MRKYQKLALSLLATLLLTTYYLLLPLKANAKMTSSDYELQIPNLNFSAGNVSSDEFKLGFTGGQNAPGEYRTTGFKVLAGFWYFKSVVPFSFTVSETLIDFGTLSSGMPKTAKTTLKVTTGGGAGYQVTAQENHPLSVPSVGTIIPDTTGDSGDISEINAGLWSHNTTYGFGYTLYGQDVPIPFPAKEPAGSFFKQFADLSQSEVPQVVMGSRRGQKTRSAVVTYKVNISPSQAAGRYHNVITYIATPTY